MLTAERLRESAGLAFREADEEFAQALRDNCTPERAADLAEQLERVGDTLILWDRVVIGERKRARFGPQLLQAEKEAAATAQDQRNREHARAEAAERKVTRALALIEDTCDCEPGDPGSGYGASRCLFCDLRAALSEQARAET